MSGSIDIGVTYNDTDDTYEQRGVKYRITAVHGPHAHGQTRHAVTRAADGVVVGHFSQDVSTSGAAIEPDTWRRQQISNEDLEQIYFCWRAVQRAEAEAQNS